MEEKIKRGGTEIKINKSRNNDRVSNSNHSRRQNEKDPPARLSKAQKAKVIWKEHEGSYYNGTTLQVVSESKVFFLSIIEDHLYANVFFFN